MLVHVKHVLASPSFLFETRTLFWRSRKGLGLWLNYTELVPEYSHLLQVFKRIVNTLDRFITYSSMT